MFERRRDVARRVGVRVHVRVVLAREADEAGDRDRRLGAEVAMVGDHAVDDRAGLPRQPLVAVGLAAVAGQRELVQHHLRRPEVAPDQPAVTGVGLGVVDVHETCPIGHDRKDRVHLPDLVAVDL
ncbi:hypothetical protein [Nannocystis pusilla]|uniref:hypothetical protein n=1 Tax=Nannocystis pusilla TaxID=889268 RepID=UPI003B801706